MSATPPSRSHLVGHSSPPGPGPMCRGLRSGGVRGTLPVLVPRGGRIVPTRLTSPGETGGSGRCGWACYSMAFSAGLARAGTPPQGLEVSGPTSPSTRWATAGGSSPAT